MKRARAVSEKAAMMRGRIKKLVAHSKGNVLKELRYVHFKVMEVRVNLESARRSSFVLNISYINLAII